MVPRAPPGPCPRPARPRDVAGVRPSARPPGLCVLARRLARHLPDPLQRRDPFPRDGLKLGPELGRVVGDQLGPVARPADLDVEALMGGQMRMPRFHGGDHVVDRPALESVDGRGPGMVEMAKLRIVSVQLQLLPVLHPTPGLDDEALHPIGSLDDLGLEIGQDAGQGAVKDRPLIGAVGEQFPEKGKQTEQGRQQRETAVAILNVGGGDDAVQQQALRIDQNMPLLALDQLAGIEAVAVDASPPFSALFTL